MSRTGHRSKKGLRQSTRATPAVMSRTSAVLDLPACPAKGVIPETATEVCPAKTGNSQSTTDQNIRKPLANLTNRGAAFQNCVFHFSN